MPNRKIKEEIVSQIIPLYLQWLSGAKIAKKIWISDHTVFVILKKNGVQRRNNGVLWKDNPNWKWWYTKTTKQLRKHYIYKQWRKKILERDQYICVHCWSKKILEVDHIIPLYKLMKEHIIRTITEARECKQLWDINNWRTLCKSCHKKTPTYGVSI